VLASPQHGAWQCEARLHYGRHAGRRVQAPARPYMHRALGHRVLALSSLQHSARAATPTKGDRVPTGPQPPHPLHPTHSALHKPFTPAHCASFRCRYLIGHSNGTYWQMSAPSGCFSPCRLSYGGKGPKAPASFSAGPTTRRVRLCPRRRKSPDGEPFAAAGR
jgi:hypothetical protein